MYKSFIVLITLVTSNFLFAQESTKQFPLELSFPKERNSWVLTTDSKALWMIQTSNKELLLQELDLELDAKNEQRVQMTDISPLRVEMSSILSSFYQEFRGGFFNDGKYQLLFSSGDNKKKFHLLTYNPTSKSVAVTGIEDYEKKERMVKAIAHGNAIYFVTIKKNSSELIIREIKSSQQIKKTVFNLQALNRQYIPYAEAGIIQSTLYTELTQTMATIGERPTLELTVVDSAGLSHLQMSNDKVKMYFLNEKIYLTVDVPFYQTGTLFFELNLDSGEHKATMIPYPTVESTQPTHNSFLHDNKIFSIKSERSGVKVNIYDLESKELMQELQFRSKEEIPFANTAILETGSSWNMDNQKVLPKTKALVNRMLRNNSVISAYTSESNDIILTIGSYQYVPPSQGMGIPIASVGFGTGNMFFSIGVFIPTSWYTNDFVRNAYFQAKFNANTFEHINGKVPSSDLMMHQNKIWKHKELVRSKYRRTFNCESIFKFNGDFYYGYYDRKGKTYHFDKL